MASVDFKSRPRPHWIGYLISLVCYGVMLLPLAAIAFYSFLSPGDASEISQWSFTLDWYRALIHDESIIQALTTSLVVAIAASLGATVLGLLGALGLHRHQFSGREVISGLATLPLALPELVLGLASVIWFGTTGLSLGISTVIIGHVTLTTAYVLTIINARLSDFDSSVLEAASDLGATPWQVARRVTIPLLAPAIGAGAMMAFTLSFDDFMISFFTAGVDEDTLPMRIYSMIRFGINREIYALSTGLILLTVSGLAVSSRLRRRSIQL